MGARRGGEVGLYWAEFELAGVLMSACKAALCIYYFVDLIARIGRLADYLSVSIDLSTYGSSSC